MLLLAGEKPHPFSFGSGFLETQVRFLEATGASRCLAAEFVASYIRRTKLEIK